MNIHPLLVHFPIALLTTYSVLELIRFKNFQLKAGLVILGALAGYPTILAGLAAERLIKSPVTLSIIEVHEKFAISTIAIFSIIALNYIWAIWRRDYDIKYKKTIWVLALAGLICVSFTGALGASIIYGPKNDPFTAWVYNLFFK